MSSTRPPLFFHFQLRVARPNSPIQPTIVPLHSRALHSLESPDSPSLVARTTHTSPLPATRQHCLPITPFIYLHIPPFFPNAVAFDVHPLHIHQSGVDRPPLLLTPSSLDLPPSQHAPVPSDSRLSCAAEHDAIGRRLQTQLPIQESRLWDQIGTDYDT
jgi:hypothetical protein